MWSASKSRYSGDSGVVPLGMLATTNHAAELASSCGPTVSPRIDGPAPEAGRAVAMYARVLVQRMHLPDDDE